jgi:uncharacterized membrane protein (DUF2068 family)
MSARGPGELKTVAVIEAVKGVLVLIAAGLFFHLLQGDLQSMSEALVRHFHLNPARHNPGIFMATVADFWNAHKLALSAGAIAYATVRFVEAYGLWHGRSWAWGFAIITGGLYIPFELAELAHRASWPAVTVLVLNIAVVVMLWRARSSAR